MKDSKRVKLKTKNLIHERIKWENMRRQMLTSLAFVVLFCVVWVAMILRGTHPIPLWGGMIGLVITVAYQMGFFIYGFYWMGQKKKADCRYICRGYWGVTGICVSVLVFLASTELETMIYLGLIYLALALIPLVPKKDFKFLLMGEGLLLLECILFNRVDVEHIIYLALGLGLCSIINRQGYVAFESKQVDGRKLSSVKDQAERDPMTGLLNRRGLENRIAAVWPMCVRQQMDVAVIMMDIDNFKKYNDSFGHPQGDVCIKAVAGKIMEATHRKTDYAARVGGEEFLVFLTGINQTEALKWCKKCKDSIEEMMMSQSEENFLPFVSISMGVTCNQPYGGPEFWELQGEADRQLYMAKESGRACIHMNDQCYSRTTPQINRRQYYLGRGFRSLG